MASENLNVEMLATEMGMSTSSLYRKVKGLSGLSPVDFIKLARLKKAVQMMQDGETRINEIAFLTGFSSPAYFSICFQKQYGKSPSDFMKEH
ncbi:MAG: AraC family transcriptional regulator [Parabacteroides sp.]|nr:AraC family transcriptional regulator [Parabacteroides sp.]